jgi:hypothetical protein
MTTREDVLAYFEQQGAGRGVYHVAAHFECSVKAAAKHVARLWIDQLVESTTDRPRGTRFRLGAHEQLEGLRFRLTERGRRRLAYYRLGHQADQGHLPIG